MSGHSLQKRIPVLRKGLLAMHKVNEFSMSAITQDLEGVHEALNKSIPFLLHTGVMGLEFARGILDFLVEPHGAGHVSAQVFHHLVVI